MTTKLMSRKATTNALKFAVEQFKKHDVITVCCNDYFTTMLESALSLLTEVPVEPEVEWADYNWWYVCGECHGNINDHDSYCRHCGRKVKWE